MATVRRFEDLLAWQKSRQLYSAVHQAITSGQGARDYVIRDQICRASLSVMSNIAEGFERHSSRELHQFLVIAGASCGEVRSQLYAAMDVGYIDEQTFERLYDLCVQTGKLITAFRLSLANRHRDKPQV